MFSAYLNDKLNTMKETSKFEALQEAKIKVALKERKKKPKKSDSVGSMSSVEEPTADELEVMRL